MGKIDLLQGNLEMMILRVLGGGAQHGWGFPSASMCFRTRR